MTFWTDSSDVWYRISNRDSGKISVRTVSFILWRWQNLSAEITSKALTAPLFLVHGESIGCPRIIRTCIFPQLSLLRWNRWRCGYQNFMKYSSKGKKKCHTLQKSLMTPFSHYFRFALRNCFSLFVQVPTRQLLKRGATPDSTTERLTSKLLESL